MTRISPRLSLLAAALALAGASCATLPEPPAQPERRALVVGIDHYSVGADPDIVEARGLRDLRGAVRDADTMASVLGARGYTVSTLLDEQATRAALLDAIDRHLVEPTRPGDDVVFYFAGHGSKLATGDRREADGQDETLVPVDAARGVPDLRDDTLRRRLRPVLDRGGRLTVILDACYSGAATRGLPPERRTRAVAPARGRSPAPDTVPEPAGSTLDGGDLEAGGALILAAAQDHQEAHETDGPEPRGVFTEALLRALGSAAPRESAATTLRRAAARMASDGWLQHPVLAGSPERLRRGLLAPDDNGPDAGTPHAVVVAFEGDAEGSTIRLDGGWSRGLRENDELIANAARLRLVEVDPTRSLGRRIDDGGAPITPGTLFRRARLGVPTEPDLRVWMPESPLSHDQLLRLDRRLAELTRKRGIEKLDNPWSTPPSHVARFDETIGWRLVDRSGDGTQLGIAPDDTGWAAVIDRLPPGARLFLQLPLPAGTARHVALGAGSKHAAIEYTSTSTAHYQLVGRRVGGADEGPDDLAFAWTRPGVGDHDADDALLPPRTAEHRLGDDPERFGLVLTEAAQQLSRIRFLLTVESTRDNTFPYRLALRRVGDTGRAEPIVGVDDERLVLHLGDTVGLALVATVDHPPLEPRYVYVVLLDANGRRQLLFPHPRHGSVENRFPRATTEPDERHTIPIGPQPILRVGEPTGLDTYLLLALDRPLADPLVLDEDGVRAPRDSDHPLARLLLLRHAGARGDATTLPTDWSIDRATVRVVDRRSRGGSP